MTLAKPQFNQILMVCVYLLVGGVLSNQLFLPAKAEADSIANQASEPAPEPAPEPTSEQSTPTSSTPAPEFTTVDHYTTTIAPTGDPADIYFPVVSDPSHSLKFPIALLLQGALVDKADYSNFAAQVARYGFVVVVPNHERQVTAPTGQTVVGLASEERQVNDVLAQMAQEEANPASPIAGIVDTGKLGLLGHSFGGYVGLGAIQNICFPGICTGEFIRPPELMAGIFYGTNFRVPPQTGTYTPIDNQGIATGLITGSLDQIADAAESQATYDQIQDAPKILITVEGTNHYSITNQDNPTRDPSRPTLDQTTAIETIARWSALFLRAHLLADQAALNYVYNTGDAIDSQVTVINQKE